MTTTTQQIHTCLACGYVYEEQAQTVCFQALPDAWCCPVCQAPKSDFEQQTTATQSTQQHSTKGTVIVGAGLAGWSVVDAIRSLDKDAPITLISADDADRYHKPMLSVAISQNKTAKDLVRATGDAAAQAANIKLMSQTTLLSINSDQKILHTTQGDVAYDNLVLAIGAHPIYPPNISTDNTWHVNHLTPFSKLQARLNTSKRIAILGGGMVGTELAEDLHASGHQVCIIDKSPRPLNALFPPAVTERILAAICDIGVEFIAESIVEEISGSNKKTIKIKNLKEQTQREIVVDEVVVCTGLAIDEMLPKQAGIEIDKSGGILVNPNTLQTNISNIYALGDCISIDGLACRYIAPHRPQATVIASQILQNTGQYQHKPPMIRLKNKCITVIATGLPKAQGDWQITNDTGNELALELHENGCVIAKVNLKIPIKTD